MSIICVGDLHIRSSEIYYRAQKKFLNWLLENYKDNTIIQLGDLWDTSSPRNDIEDEIIGILKQFKDFRILTGNHDQSKIKGNSLLHLRHHENITVYDDVTEVTIGKYRCLMLPYKYDMSEYKDIRNGSDYIFCHFTNPEDQFADEGIELKLQGFQIYGHTHTFAQYDNKLVLGCPVITRNGEKNNSIIEINNGGITFITPPVFFDIQTISYGDKIENFDYLYNVISAPSVKSVYELYPMLNIRSSGIQVVYASKDDKEIQLNKMGDDLNSLYKLFCIEKEIDVAFQTEGIDALSNFEVV